MEPMEILHEIVAAEKAARGRVAAAFEERDTFEERLEKLRGEILPNAYGSAEREIEEARRAAEAAAAQEREAITRASDEAVEALKSRFRQRKDAGIEKVFRLVVGIDD